MRAGALLLAAACALSACGGRVVEDRDNVAPTAVAGGSRTVSPGEEVVFDASASRDEDGEIVSYAWTFPGDEIVEGVSVTRVFPEEGLFRVSLEVTDDLGARARAEIVITVEAGAPRAVATASTLTPALGEEVSFDSAGTAADAPIARMSWRFGDGSPVVDGATATHAFTTSGPKTVTLTVEDEDGRRGTATVDLVVRGVEVEGVYDLGVSPATFSCAQYAASWPVTTLEIERVGAPTSAGEPVRLTASDGTVFEGNLDGDQISASATWVGETGGVCVSAPVEGTLTATFGEEGRFSANLTAFYDLGVPCQCSALFQLEGTRR